MIRAIFEGIIIGLVTVFSVMLIFIVVVAPILSAN